MADFSKEYCERYDFEMPHDFSVIEIFNDLKPGYYKSCICEGYGFIAVLKTENEICQVAFPLPYEEEYDGVPSSYDEDGEIIVDGSSWRDDEDMFDEDEQMIKWVPFDQVTKDTYKTIK